MLPRLTTRINEHGEVTYYLVYPEAELQVYMVAGTDGIVQWTTLPAE